MSAFYSNTGKTQVYRIVIIINRPALLDFVKEVTGKELSIEQCINLENQIESTVEMMTEDLDYLDKEWIEAAIVNDNIPM